MLFPLIRPHDGALPRVDLPQRIAESFDAERESELLYVKAVSHTFINN